jgi:hypothetical protein
MKHKIKKIKKKGVGLRPVKSDGGVWKKIGIVGVDSGMLMVCDPCYVEGEWESEEFVPGSKVKHSFSYNACCVKTVDGRQFGQLNYKLGHAGVGVVFSSGVGDGVYPVYARVEDVKGWGKRVVEVRIDMGLTGAQRQLFDELKKKSRKGGKK